MKKFTVFTLILTIIIIVVVSEIIVNEYLPNLTEESTADLDLTLPTSLDLAKTVKTDVVSAGLNNKLGADLGDTNLTDTGEEYTDEYTDEFSEFLSEPTADSEPTMPLAPAANPNPSGLADFEDENFAAYSTNVYLRDEQIKSAGFVGAYLENEQYDGYLFKSIPTNDLSDTEITKSLIRTADELLAKVYIFKIGIDNDINDVYQLLKMRASEGLNIEINETDDFGNNSFYMNDSRRSNTAFLTTRIGAFIYAFSYPKEYHSQVKNLIQLISWELG